MSNKQLHKALRSAFNEAVFERDGHKCRICGRRPPEVEYLNAHHIVDRHDAPNGGYTVLNGITVCPGCHVKAEAEHNGQEPEPGYSRAELYALIGTTFDEAWEASEKLAG